MGNAPGTGWHVDIGDRRASGIALIATLGLGFAGVAAASCTDAGRGVPAADARTRLPSVEKVVVPGLDSVGPERRVLTMSFAVSDNGLLAFTEAYDSGGRLVAMVDTTGALTGRMLEQGQGPEEASGLLHLAMRNERVLIYETSGAAGRFLEFAGDGALLRTSPRAAPAGFLLGVANDSADLVIYSMRESTLSLALHSVSRTSIATAEARAVVLATDSAYLALSRYGDRVLNVPTAASVASVIVLANPYSYRLQSYTSGGQAIAAWGRDVPLRFRTAGMVDSMMGSATTGQGGQRIPELRGERERLATTPVTHFSALLFDGEGRLWALGRDDDGMAFGDVFADTAYLGRVTVPCRTSFAKFAIAGRWLAMLCAPSRDDRDVELRLFRIVG